MAQWLLTTTDADSSDFRNAHTGEIIFQIPSKSDVGRAMAADIDPTNPGLEMWSTDSHGIRNIKGEILNSAQDPDDPQHQQHLKLGDRYLSVNFGIWWDGDLLRELLDRETVSKYDWTQKSIIDVKKLEGVVFNNGTKSNPSLQRTAHLRQSHPHRLSHQLPDGGHPLPPFDSRPERRLQPAF